MRKGRGGRRSMDGMKSEDKAKKENYYSTGEICHLLKGIVSRSTVTRLFDQGKLGGQVNPITGRREIEWQTSLDWLKEHGVSPDNIVFVEKRLGEEWKCLKE